MLVATVEEEEAFLMLSFYGNCHARWKASLQVKDTHVLRTIENHL